MKKLIIIGASGHGKVVADVAKKNGYTSIVFLDNDPEVKACAGYPVLGSDLLTSELEGDLFIAIGNEKTRRRLMDREAARQFPVLIHPSAVIAEDAEIGIGSVIMAGAVVNPGARLGKGCIVNTCSSVDHDCIIGDYCHISVGSHLSGTVVVGDNVWIGAGVTVSNNLSICPDAVIGAGALIIEDIVNPGVYTGVPARLQTAEHKEQR